MKETKKIFYIHGFHVFGESKQLKLIEKVVGKNNLMTTKINTNRCIASFILLLLFIACVMTFNIYVSYLFSPLTLFIITIVLSVIVLIIIYIIGSHLILYYIMKKSIKQAEQKIQLYNPDIIVGIYFGAVVAMNLNYKNGKKPLILVSPSVKTFQKFTHNAKADLSSFPYVLIVNGSKDKTTTLKTCDQLIATVPMGKGRIEIVDDDHSYLKLKESDFKSWIKEAIYQPSTCVLDVARKLKDEPLGHKINVNENIYDEFSGLQDDANEEDPLV